MAYFRNNGAAACRCNTRCGSVCSRRTAAARATEARPAGAGGLPPCRHGSSFFQSAADPHPVARSASSRSIFVRTRNPRTDVQPSYRRSTFKQQFADRHRHPTDAQVPAIPGSRVFDAGILAASVRPSAQHSMPPAPARGPDVTHRGLCTTSPASPTSPSLPPPALPSPAIACATASHPAASTRRVRAGRWAAPRIAHGAAGPARLSFPDRSSTTMATRPAAHDSSVLYPRCRTQSSPCR